MERRPELAAAGVRLLLSGNRLRELAVRRDQLAECRAAAAAQAQAVNKTQADDEEKPDTVVCIFNSFVSLILVVKRIAV